MNKYRVAVDFSGGCHYDIWATNTEMAKQKAMEIWFEEGINENCIEIITAHPCMVENLTTGEVEYDEDV